jgi:hypothetical protein
MVESNKTNKNKLIVQDIEVALLKIDEKSYASLTDVARIKKFCRTKRYSKELAEREERY